MTVDLTLWPLYPRGKIQQYSLDRRLGVPLSRSTRRGKMKIRCKDMTHFPIYD
jgi:hypothetical protein